MAGVAVYDPPGRIGGSTFIADVPSAVIAFFGLFVAGG